MSKRKPKLSASEIADKKFREGLLFRPQPLPKPRRKKPLAGQKSLFDDKQEHRDTGGHYAEPGL